jgi:hypothetical protein
MCSDVHTSNNEMKHIGARDLMMIYEPSNDDFTTMNLWAGLAI